MPNANLIGLTSPLPGCGKSTCANHLKAQGYQILPMAGTLKTMTAVLLKDLGAPIIDPETDGIQWIQDNKSTWLSSIMDGLGTQSCSVRWILQSLGTDWGRKWIHPSIWIRVWQAKAQRLLDQGLGVVCDDLRFINEANLIEEMGGVVWRIDRPGHHVDDTVKNHASEGELNTYPVDAVIVNAGSIQELSECLDALLNEFRFS